MERLKAIGLGFVGTALCLVLWDYWLLRQRVTAIDQWANAVAPFVQRLQQADMRNATVAQEAHQPLPTPKH